MLILSVLKDVLLKINKLLSLYCLVFLWFSSGSPLIFSDFLIRFSQISARSAPPPMRAAHYANPYAQRIQFYVIL